MKPYLCRGCRSLNNISPYVSGVKFSEDEWISNNIQIEAKIEWICPKCGHHNIYSEVCEANPKSIYKYIREVNGDE